VRRRTDPALLLLPKEQRVGYLLAGLSAIGFFVVWTPWNGGSHATGFGLALLFSFSLALVTRQGHRLWTAFTAFLIGTFGPWGFAYVFGAIYIGFAFWLGLRAHRAVKASVEGRPVATEVRDAVTAKPAPKKSSSKNPSSVTSGRVTPKKTPPRRNARRR